MAGLAPVRPPLPSYGCPCGWAPCSQVTPPRAPPLWELPLDVGDLPMGVAPASGPPAGGMAAGEHCRGCAQPPGPQASTPVGALGRRQSSLQLAAPYDLAASGRPC
ncbi:hypothetical protein B296_00041542 [Ensete ventricosum]|uniref:Uncharacterized protein n=1 Tax=Ensete ventricosum TaxID=4639 RepID=A0A426Z0P3_ENSVE|nr:hypothetical protein B296_00041542 [Ensete ventricosum]